MTGSKLEPVRDLANWHTIMPSGRQPADAVAVVGLAYARSDKPPIDIPVDTGAFYQLSPKEQLIELVGKAWEQCFRHECEPDRIDDRLTETIEQSEREHESGELRSEPWWSRIHEEYLYELEDIIDSTREHLGDDYETFVFNTSYVPLDPVVS